MMGGKAWRCSLCLLVLTLTLREMLRHIYQSHSGEPNFHIECGIDGCSEKYWVFDSYRRHIYRQHAEYMDQNISTVDVVNALNDNEKTSQEDEEDGLNDEITNHTDIDDGLNEEDYSATTESIEEETLERFSAGLIFELKYKQLVTQKGVNTVVTRSSSLLRLAQEHLLQKLEQGIKSSDSIEHVKSVVSRLRKDTEYVDPFEKVKSSYLQKKYIYEHYPFIEPKKIVVGETVTRKRKHGQFTSVVKEDLFYYIPLQESIQQLLNNNFISDILLRSPKNDGHFLEDVFDGTVYKEHSLSKGQNTIFLTMYYDDFEVCNPLGSKSHKISMFYYSVLNFPPRYRSKLSSIRLLAVSYKKIIDNHGIDKIIEPFIDELKSLYHGTTFNVNGIETLIYVALLNVVGDTPANNLLGGFKEGVGGSLKKCRQCYCEYEDIQSKFCEKDFNIRSIDKHLANCAHLERTATKQMQSYLSTLYGINRRSLLTEVPEFDICQMMPEDFMHVFLEGVAQYEIKEILKFYILEPSQIFSIHDFNQKLKYFNYGYDDLDKRPTPILLTNLRAGDNRIRQSAGQMLVFLKIIPFIMNELVDCTDTHMEFLYALLDLYHILYSPVLSLGTLCVLKNLIEDHLNNFKTLFPNLPVIPKQHYMIHFPMLLKKFGPAIRTWCMRFEGKHKQCKRIANKQNYANLPLSIAKNIQLSDSIDFYSEDEYHPMFANDFVVRNSNAVLNEDKCAFISKLKTFYSLDVNEVRSVFKVDHIIINSLNYIINQSYLVADADHILPEFGLVRNIYILNQKNCFFEIQMFSTICFNNKYKSYEIEIPNIAEAHIIKNLEDLVDHLAYSSVERESRLFIPIRYSLDDMISKYTCSRL